MRVLFIDDEPAIRHVFARELCSKGFLVDVASDAAEARQLAQQCSYALIATDLGLPDTDGVELVEELRKSHPFTA